MRPALRSDGSQCEGGKRPDLATWQSLEPRTGHWVDYEWDKAAALEAQFAAGEVDCTLSINELEFQISFKPGAMVQINSDGGKRRVRRIDASGTPSLQVGDRLEIWSNSNSSWCMGVVDKVMNDKVSVTYHSPQDEVCNKELPTKSDLFRRVYSSGQDIEVFSVSQQTWCPGKASSIGNGFVQVCYQMPDALGGAWAKKSLHANSNYIRIACEVQQPSKSDARSTASTNYPTLLVDDTWEQYEPAERCVVVIAPGAGTRANAHVYEFLKRQGWEVIFVHAPDYDQSPDGSGFLYPDGWYEGEPDLSLNHGRNLATLADDIVLPKIRELVAHSRGPSAIIAGSRGGQVTLPRLWKCGWRGPSIVINGGCAYTTTIPPSPLKLALITGGNDTFPTKDPKFTKRRLKKEDPNWPVLVYHHPSEGHMPGRLSDIILPVLETVVDADRFLKVATKTSDKPRQMKEHLLMCL